MHTSGPSCRIGDDAARAQLSLHGWLQLLVYYACGALAAAQIGKLATLAPAMQRELGLGLTTMALLIALIEAGGALLGVRAGRIAQRVGLAPSLLAALALLAAASGGEALAHDAATLIVWRLVEALGYVGVVVSAPVLIAERAGPRLAPPLLAAWSTFVPVGLALGAWGHGVIAEASDWRTAALVSSALTLPLMLAVFVLRERRGGPAVVAPSQGMATAPIPPVVWALAGAFGGFAALAVGVIALLPTVLVGDGLAVAAAGRWTAWASLAAVPGSLLVAFVVQRRAMHRPLAAISLLLPGLLIFVVFDPHAPVVTVGVAATVLHAALGIFGGLAFALLPAVAGTAARTAQTYGVLAQFGASGSLAGPPLLALVIEHAGWRAGAGLGCAVAVASLLLAVIALRRSG